jgi:hypothetical protein
MYCREFVGESHIRNSGFLEVAELNNIVMIFPQALSSLPENEIGCWDTYGLTGPLYGNFHSHLPPHKPNYLYTLCYSEYL